MNYLINENVVFVSGAYNGAIYDFNRNKIFSISHDANNFLLRFVQDKQMLSDEEYEYVQRLIKEKLLKQEYKFKVYEPDDSDLIQLNFAWLEITQACNMRCIHCYEGEEHAHLHDCLTVSEWKRIIKDLFDNGCLKIQFIGGEPACYSNIIELIDFAGSLDFKSIGFFTNATMISDELLQCFIHNNVHVNVSIYGHDSIVHDSITKIHGSFNHTVANIRRMIERKLPVNIAITIMKENEQYFEDSVSFVKSLGVHTYKYDLVRQVNGCNQSCHLSAREDLIKNKFRTKPSFAISKEWFNRAHKQNTCWYGKVAVAENGDVMPCIFERNISYGNLRNCSIKDLLQSTELIHHWFMNFSQIDECNVCEYRFACKDCRPLGLLNGGLNKKNIRCLYHPTTGVWDNILGE